jgi:thiol:disulfide interchange protein DsbG
VAAESRGGDERYDSGCGASRCHPSPYQAGRGGRGAVDALSGLIGYAARLEGKPLALYLTADGEHVIVGSMLDAQGNNLTLTQLKRHLPEPEFGQAWPLLQKATWIREGGVSAKRVIYVLTDPDCPYCHAFWRASHGYLGADVQVRNILVGGRSAQTVRANADRGSAASCYRRFTSVPRGLEVPVWGGPVKTFKPGVEGALPQETLADFSVLARQPGSEATHVVRYPSGQGKRPPPSKELFNRCGWLSAGR